jgi:hypothetical protein
MHSLLDFDFVAILNLFVILLWPASGTYAGAQKNVVGVIMLILTVIAVILDIFFLVLRLAHAS